VLVSEVSPLEVEFEVSVDDICVDDVCIDDICIVLICGGVEKWSGDCWLEMGDVVRTNVFVWEEEK